MSGDGSLSDFIRAKGKAEDHFVLIKNIVFSEDFYNSIRHAIYFSDQTLKSLREVQGLCDRVPFYVNPLMKNRWMLLMSDDTVRFSEDEEPT